MTSTGTPVDVPKPFVRRVVCTSGTAPLYVYVLVAGVCAQFMSGQAAAWGLPISPDRLLIPLGLLLLAAHSDIRVQAWTPRLVHVLLVLASTWALGSLVLSDNLSINTLYMLVDAFGILPFVLMCIAPVVFSTPSRRDVLLGALTILGAYLGLIAVLEGLGLYGLVFPGYIFDPQSNHFGRAAGPSTQVASNGLALFACAVAATGFAVRHRGGIRLSAGVIALACLAGTFFTLTRSIWLGTLLGILAAAIADHRARRSLVPVLVGVVLLGGAVLALAPGVLDQASERANDAGSVYDRVTANDAALRVVAAHPLEGVGYQRFHLVENDWVWQGDTTPIAATGIAVHNVLLGHAAELGVPGATLWLLALMAAGASTLGRRARAADLHGWRIGVLGYTVCWVTVSMMVPISYALPTSLLWLGLGIVADREHLGFVDRPHVPATPHPPALAVSEGGRM